jgi:hypothetical protein
MKKLNFLSLMLLVSVSIIFTSCDEIKAPYGEENVFIIDTNNKKVLIEEFRPLSRKKRWNLREVTEKVK